MLTQQQIFLQAPVAKRVNISLMSFWTTLIHCVRIIKWDGNSVINNVNALSKKQLSPTILKSKARNLNIRTFSVFIMSQFIFAHCSHGVSLVSPLCETKRTRSRGSTAPASLQGLASRNSVQSSAQKPGNIFKIFTQAAGKISLHYTVNGGRWIALCCNYIGDSVSLICEKQNT